ncbi:hypothetical protein TrST_g14312 [Triparma strigata]|uniref:diacylglycerol O-acyltransferase n=1 Tax=Triparma strigata TaxID=1606541 RepID=A0A9W7DYC9_9STRA|nr:hypothetical protein TrST_g14312 [Triparma strigata]
MDSDPLLNSTNIYDVILCKDEYSGVSETEKRHRSFMGRKKSTFGRLESSGQHSMSKGLATTSAGSKSLARRGTYNWTSGGGKSFNSSLGSKDNRRLSLKVLQPNGAKSEAFQKRLLDKRKGNLGTIVEEKKEKDEPPLLVESSSPSVVTTMVGRHDLTTVPTHHPARVPAQDREGKGLDKELTLLTPPGRASVLFNTLLAKVYTQALPQLTWLLLLAAIVSPSRLRPVVLLLQILPIIVMTFTEGCGTRARSLFRQIAVSRAMDVTFQEARTPGVTESESSSSCSESDSSSSEESDREDDSTLFGFHPHGKCPLEVFPLLASSPETFENMHLAQSSLGKGVPTVGYTTALFGNVIDATRAAITKSVKSGGDVGIFPGGVKEMILCVPGSDEIPIVRHAGFLRLAAALECPIRPSFIFGMNDSYESPFPKIDEAVYRATGAAFPWWYCSSKGEDQGQGPRMVVGKKLRHFEGETEEEFTDRYYAAVNNLFESHKLKIGKDRYKAKRLVFIDVHKKQKLKGPTTPPRAAAITPHIITTKLALGFVLVFFLDRAYTGAYRKFSTWGTYGESDHNIALALHVVSSTGWGLTSAFLTLKPFNKYHRKIGSVGVTAAVLMAISGALITLKAAEGKNLNVNSLFHSLCNLQISFVTIYMAVYGVLCAASRRFKDLKAHKQTFRTLHILIGVNFMPRVFALFLRHFLDFHVNKAACFSLSCAIQVGWQISQIAGSRKGSALRVMIIRCNQVALSAASGALVLNLAFGVCGREVTAMGLGVGVGLLAVSDLKAKSADALKAAKAELLKRN